MVGEMETDVAPEVKSRASSLPFRDEFPAFPLPVILQPSGSLKLKRVRENVFWLISLPVWADNEAGRKPGRIARYLNQGSIVFIICRELISRKGNSGSR